MLLIGLVVSGIWGYRVYRRAMRLRHHAGHILAMDIAQLDDLGPTLALIQDDVDVLRRNLTIPLAVAPALGWVPRYGPTIAAAPKLFDAGDLLLGAVATVWETVSEPVTGLATQTVDLGKFPLALVESITRNRERLQHGADEARHACDLLGELDATRLDPRLGSPLARIQPSLPLVAAAFDALPLLPRIAGSADPQTWLLLVQNSDELRPTGGFISSLGVATIEDAALSAWALDDSYRFENWEAPHPDPPDALREHMGLDLWVTRDGNWWPDFPTSARAVSDLYALNQETTVDGVVAVDMHAAALVLDALAPLKLPNGESIKRGQALSALRQSWSLPKGSLVTDGVAITATHPYTAIVVSQHFVHRTGSAWFDTVELIRGDEGTNLVSNPSYEIDGDGDGLPDAWGAVGFAEEDGLVADMAHSDGHSLRVLGDPEGEKSVAQRISVTGDKGDVFHVSAMSKADRVEVKGGTYALTVAFVGGEQQSTHRLDYPPLTHDWASAGSNKVLGDWWVHRKDIIQHAMGAALGKLATDPMSIRWLDVLDAANRALRGRHVQCYATDPELTAFLQRYGWDGALLHAEGDMLCIVDANVGYNKVTANIDQRADYYVKVDGDQRLQARLRVRYTNPSPPSDELCDKYRQYTPTYEALAQGCYWDYVRVYVPLGSELLSGTGGDEPITTFTELERTVLATSILLLPGETRELEFEYLLPATTVLDGVYTLSMQKQAGVYSLPCTITVAGLDKVVWADPPPDTTEVGSVSWEIDLIGEHMWTVQLDP